MLPNLFSKPITAASLRKSAAGKNPPAKKTVDLARSAEQDAGDEPLPLPAMHAVRRVVLIGIHHCPQCNSETELNLGQFIESTSSSKDLLRSRCIKSADWSKWHALPRAIEYLGVEDRLCPRCLGRMPIDNPAQLRLFA